MKTFGDVRGAETNGLYLVMAAGRTNTEISRAGPLQKKESKTRDGKNRGGRKKTKEPRQQLRKKNTKKKKRRK